MPTGMKDVTELTTKAFRLAIFPPLLSSGMVTFTSPPAGIFSSVSHSRP